MKRLANALLALSVASLFGCIDSKRSKDAANNTGLRLAAMQTALEAFKADYGSYPICEDLGEGGLVLYKTLYGDFNLNGIPDHSAEDLNDPEIKTYMPKLKPPSLDGDGVPTESSLVMPIAGGWAVVDAWNEPFYYICPRDGSGGRFSKGSYDLWSLGNDPDPTDDDRSMWIKNW